MAGSGTIPHRKCWSYDGRKDRPSALSLRDKRAISSNEMHVPFRERLTVSPVGKSDGDRYCATPIEVFAEEPDHP
jgi:hypothetical protein